SEGVAGTGSETNGGCSRLVMGGQKRVLKGVHARLRRAMDARERAYDPRIHRKKALHSSRWIAGSSPAMTADGSAPTALGIIYDERAHLVFAGLMSNPRLIAANI